jgi:protein-disulfide isomerase
VPNPAKVYAVPITDDPARGPAGALVTIVRAGEYACPFCERVRPTLDQLRADYPKDVRIVYKDFVVHPQLATDAALAACGAARQGKFDEMDTQLWERAFKPRRFEVALYETIAGELGLDLDRFRADMAGPCTTKLHTDMSELEQVGVNATPIFFINGRYLAGAQPYATFKSLVDEELARAKDRVKHGAKRTSYYADWVLKPGLTKLAP